MSNIHLSEKLAGFVDYKELAITSEAFEQGAMIPVKYSCDGANVNPSLKIGGIPGDAKSLALIVEDPDAPAGTWVHWLVWNIPVVHQIDEKSMDGTVGINDFMNKAYDGPCPPYGIHRYYFKVYALDTMLELHEGSRKFQLEKAMAGHILAYGELAGRYKRR